jgi:hypothetical protein
MVWMKYIKFTLVKLVLFVFCLVCLVILPVKIITAGTQKYVVQVAASKTPIDIKDFAHKYNINDSIIEIQSNGWNRYLVGNFDDFESALDYSKVINQKSKLKAFPRKLDEQDIISHKAEVIDSMGRQNEPQIAAIPVDSVQNEPDSVLNPGGYDKKPEAQSKFSILTFGGKKVTDFRKLVAAFGDKHFSGIFHRKLDQVMDATLKYPIILLFILLIVFFILNIITVFFVLYISNWLKNKKDRYTLVYRELYEKELLSYLFEEKDWEKTLAGLKNIRRPLNRKIFTSILFNFQENLRGEMDKELPEIFEKLKLQRYSLKMAKSAFYYKKINGIRELTHFYSKGASDIIPNYLNDKNDLVRGEAQTSYVRLHTDSPFDFFHSLTKPFTQWTQMVAFYLFRQNQLQTMRFADFLNSTHPNVRNFSLLMITFYQQLENTSEILKLLDDKLELTRFLAIKAVNDLRLFEARVLIKSRYSLETRKNKMEILKALKNFGNEDDFDFLKSVILTGSVSEKTEACRSMYYMNNEGRKRLFQINRETSQNLGPYIAHIIDPRNL